MRPSLSFFLIVNSIAEMLVVVSLINAMKEEEHTTK
jgi:hypothetical protein